MDAKPDEPKTENESISSSLGNIDVELNVAATVLDKSGQTNIEPDNNDTIKKPSKKKKKKQMSPNAAKKPKKDPNKPEYPKVGYVRFMYVRREELRNEFPDMHHLDVTKKIGEEWMALSDEQKKPYLDAALDDKIRYKKEMKEYRKKAQKSGGNKNPIKRKKSKKAGLSTDTDIEPSPKKTKRRAASSDQFEFASTPKTTSVPNKPPANATTPIPAITSINTPPPSPPQSLLSIFGDIPIFTEQFLEHNRQMESELKKLRKMNTDIEQQNSVLEKYAESVQIGITKTTAEIDEMNEDNEKLTTYLNELRTKLSNQLQNLSIPSEPNGATIENIDKYMADLFGMAQTNEHGPASLNKAKDLLRKVDLNIDVKKLQKIQANAVVTA